MQEIKNLTGNSLTKIRNNANRKLITNMLNGYHVANNNLLLITCFADEYSNFMKTDVCLKNIKAPILLIDELMQLQITNNKNVT